MSMNEYYYIYLIITGFYVSKCERNSMYILYCNEENVVIRLQYYSIADNFRFSILQEIRICAIIIIFVLILCGS